MLYEFECEDCGNRETHPYPISSAPPLGAKRTCQRCGTDNLRRILSLPTFDAAKLAADRKYPYVSHRWSTADLGGGCRETGDGHPIIESKQHERDVMARTGMVRD